MAPSSVEVLVQRKLNQTERVVLNHKREPLKKGYQLKNVENNSKKLKQKQCVIFICLFAGYAIYNLSRKAICYVAPTLLVGGMMTQSNMGLINSSQHTAYAISKFIAGVVSDRLSARKLFSVGLFATGLSTLLVTIIPNTTLWIVFWFLNGLAQGCGWPACSKLIKQWFSSKHFGTCWSLLTSSSNVAGAVGPIISTFILINFNWKTSVIFTGVITIIMGLFTLMLLEDNPKTMGLTVKTEKISQSDHHDEIHMTWNELLRSPLLWIIAVCYLVAFGIKTALCDWSQVYLMQKLGHDQVQASSFISSFETGGFIGGIAAGIITDRLKNVSLGFNPRLGVASCFLMLTTIGLHMMAFSFTTTSSQVFTSAVAFMLGASVFGPISIFGIVASESFPHSISGSAHAVVALAANIGAILTGWPLSKAVQMFGWHPVISSLEIMTIGVICMMGITGKWQTVLKVKKD